MGTRLLLADDSITIQKVVGIIFSNEDYDLTVVDNGVAALDKAREAIPEVMLVDALMPGKNGYEVCQEVRADARLKNVPLLLMTGAFEPFDEGKASQCGADDFITKPFESQQLIDKVKQLLELGSERAATSAAQAPSAPYTEPESLFVPPSAESWAESVASIAPFESIPEMFDDTLQATEAVFPDDFSAATAAVEPTEMAVEVVEAEPGDDPWGVFDLTDLDEDLSPVSVVEPVDTLYGSIDEPAAFAPDDIEPGIVEFNESAEPPFTVETDRFDNRFEPLAEESFTYDAEEPTPAGETFAVGMGEPLSMLSNDPSQYEKIAAVSFAAQIEPERAVPSVSMPQVESESDFFASPAAPVERAAQSAAAVIPAASALSAEPAPNLAPQLAFGEEQLRAILSQLSREVIEKIVWDVVPDLAETIIREEIRKLKAGVVR